MKKFNEGLESFGLLTEVTGRTKEQCQLGRRSATDCGRRKQSCGSQVSNGAFDVGPGSVLGENRANDNFKAGAARPPMLRPMSSQQGIEVGAKYAGKGWIRGRLDGTALQRTLCL